MSEIKNAFVVIQVGIYRHAIFAVTDNYDLARKIAKDALDAEPDDYHSVEVWKGPMNVLLTEIPSRSTCEADMNCLEHVLSLEK